MNPNVLWRGSPATSSVDLMVLMSLLLYLPLWRIFFISCFFTGSFKSERETFTRASWWGDDEVGCILRAPGRRQTLLEPWDSFHFTPAAIMMMPFKCQVKKKKKEKQNKIIKKNPGQVIYETPCFLTAIFSDGHRVFIFYFLYSLTKVKNFVFQLTSSRDLEHMHAETTRMKLRVIGQIVRLN